MKFVRAEFMESKGEFKNKKSVMHLGEFFIYREF